MLVKLHPLDTDIETEGSLGLTVYQHQSKLGEEFISEESGQSDRVVSLSF